MPVIPHAHDEDVPGPALWEHLPEYHGRHPSLNNSEADLRRQHATQHGVPAVPGDKDRWSVEYRDPSTGTWHTDTSGMVFYDTREGAMSWATRLRSIHSGIALRHEIITYEPVP